MALLRLLAVLCAVVAAVVFEKGLRLSRDRDDLRLMVTSLEECEREIEKMAAIPPWKHRACFACSALFAVVAVALCLWSF